MSTPTLEPDLYTQLQQDLHYQPPAAALDELLGDDAGVSPHWRYLLQSVTALGGAELSKRQRKVTSLLRDDGVTYRSYPVVNGRAPDPTWRMDLLPWIIDSGRWREIETGILERSELFNLILKDIYGERSLIQRGIVPPEVIYGHTGFLRACQGITLPGDNQLVLHSADLVRAGDGRMCVLADRTQAPSGAGYALENRVVMTRILPSIFRDSNVHRLAGFFQTLRSTLLSLAPQLGSPNIAVLTPGALNETYFEHAYLANYLGFGLVQSSDLAVRNNLLWMKGLDGWSRVDILLRRVDDVYCDPVELKGDSQLGVPGLLEVVRSGNVVIANPLGSGVLESPALLAYLGDISQHFLGHALQLPSVATWWCGDRDQLEHVRANFDDLVIKPVFRSSARNSIITAELDTPEREALLASVLARPHYYVAQERIVPSHLPALAQGALTPRPAILRAFSVAAEGSYRLMPGGLTRIGTAEGASLISNQSGSVSKDTWVVASEPQKATETTAATEILPREIRRVTGLPSRVVENMFWFGRYIERAEFGLRMTRTLLLQAADIGSGNDEAQQFLLDAVIGASDSFGVLAELGLEPVMDNREALLPVILDPFRRGSLIGSLHAMLACAEEIKELLTVDAQRVINRIRIEAQTLVTGLKDNLFSAPEEVLSPILTSLLALSGIVHESVNRSTGWGFLDLGRRLERGIQCVKQIEYLLGRGLSEEKEVMALESLLVSNESLVVYRRLYRGRAELRNALELVLLDDDNPRGLLFQLNRLSQELDEMPIAHRNSHELEDDARYLLEARSMLQLARIEDLCVVDDTSGRREQLENWCRRIDFLLSQAAISLSEKYFEKPILPQQLLRQTWGADA